MTCEDRQEEIDFHALGAAEPGEQARLRRHIDAGCECCRGSLGRAREIAGHLASSVDLVVPPETAWRRLLARIDRGRRHER